MNVILSTETQKLLADRLKSGQFESADDLVQAAIEALDLSTPDEATLREIRDAEAEADRGETRDWREVREEFKAKFLK